MGIEMQGILGIPRLAAAALQSCLHHHLAFFLHVSVPVFSPRYKNTIILD